MLDLFLRYSVTAGHDWIAIFSHFTQVLGFAFDFVLYAGFLLLPVTGWVAETWIGRYQAIIAGMVMSLTVTILMLQVSFVLLQFDMTLILAFVLAVIAVVLYTICIGSVYTS